MAFRSETRSGVEADVGKVTLLKDQTKFKSLGDLHMEKGLPPVPRVIPSSGVKNKGRLPDENEDSNGSSSNIVRDRLANNAHKLLRSMKQLLAREKTVTITGTGPPSCSSQIAGGGSKSGVIITSSKTTDNYADYKRELNTKNLTNKDQDTAKTLKSTSKTSNSNISKININQNDVCYAQELEESCVKQKEQMLVTQAFPYDARVNLQLLSTMSIPGLPSYPVLAASKSSPWNC
jgi:hypothetical protein